MPGFVCNFALHTDLNQSLLGIGQVATAVKAAGNTAAHDRLTQLFTQDNTGTLMHENAVSAVGAIIQDGVDKSATVQAKRATAGGILSNLAAELLTLLETPGELQTIITNIMSVLTLFGL